MRIVDQQLHSALYIAFYPFDFVQFDFKAIDFYLFADEQIVVQRRRGLVSQKVLKTALSLRPIIVIIAVIIAARRRC